MAAKAEMCELGFRQVSGCSSRSSDSYLASMNFGSWPAALVHREARKQPHGINRAAAWCLLDFSLLRNLQRVVYLDTEVSDCAFDF